MDCIQLSLFGKTYPEHSVPTAEKISEPCWKNLPAWNNQTFQFLNFRVEGADGAKPERSPETDGLWLGDSLTLNIGESPNAERESLLSWILEDNVPKKYYLSARACQGILTESVKAWKEATGAAGSRIAGNDRPVPVLNDQGGGVMGVSYNVTGTLRASEHGHQPIVLESNQAHATVSQTGICPTLPASMGLGGGYVPMVTERKIFDARGNGDGQIAPTITGDHENRITDYTAIAIERKTFNEQSFSSYKESDKCSTLKAKAGNIGNGSECLIAEKAIRWIVRRLTPVECERLQGYPDGYTDIGDWTDSKGKKHKYADSPRYKALGNSIALPQWFWLVQKMRPYLKEKPTLGSLFDGLGGFPLVWQRAYGEGTARWASEIEEFPMAVTKRRFGEE